MPRRPLVAALSGAILVATAFATAAGAQAAGGGDRDPYIVVLKDSAAPTRVADSVDARTGVAVGHTYRHALSGFSARMRQSRAEALKSQSRARARPR